MREITGELQVVLEEGATLTGTIESPDGQGLKDVAVSCLHDPVSTAVLRSSATDENGRFVITPLPAGTQLRLRVTGDAWNSMLANSVTWALRLWTWQGVLFAVS